MSKKLVVASTVAVTAVAFAVTAYAAGGELIMGPAGMTAVTSWQGYYDGHKDTYLSTDISSKAQAKSMHINYSASIGKVQHLPEIYLVQGPRRSRPAGCVRRPAGRSKLLAFVVGDDPDLEAWVEAGANHERQSDQQAREDERPDRTPRQRRPQLPDHQSRDELKPIG